MTIGEELRGLEESLDELDRWVDLIREALVPVLREGESERVQHERPIPARMSSVSERVFGAANRVRARIDALSELFDQLDLVDPAATPNREVNPSSSASLRRVAR